MEQWLIWVIIGAILVVGEIATTTFVLLYFGVGAFATAAAAGLGAGPVLQGVVFAGTSIGLLALTRPLIIKSMHLPDVRSNVHDLVGRTAIVTIEIDNDSSTGQIRLGTEFWTARTVEGAPIIPVDAKVEVVEVDGVTARVRALSSS